MCHTKNVPLVHALHAQSESRGQHESFHNLLDRSTEPFSVVAEYFGRGLFNKIVLVEEDNVEVGEATFYNQAVCLKSTPNFVRRLTETLSKRTSRRRLNLKSIRSIAMVPEPKQKFAWKKETPLEVARILREKFPCPRHGCVSRRRTVSQPVSKRTSHVRQIHVRIKARR